MTDKEYIEFTQKAMRNMTPARESQPASGVGDPRQLPDTHVPHDDVCHPLRYTKGLIECIDAIDSAVTGKPPEEAVCVANIIKYLWRYEEKEPVRSLRSAKWYLERLIEKVRSRTETAYAAAATEARQ